MINFDVLLEKIGGFGAAQIAICILLSYGSTIRAFNSVAPVFIAYQPDSWYCRWFLLFSL